MKILFLCVANSARSQLAEGLAKSIFGKNAEIQSAGSEPSGTVQSWAIEVLKEEGIDISKHYSKSIDQLDRHFIEKLDYVITLCAEEICPYLVSKAKRLHWPILDPVKTLKADKLGAFRKVRNEIRNKLLEFKKAHRFN